jgi:hypothetical protein
MTPSSSRTAVVTTTLPNGAPTTFTSVTVYVPGQTAGASPATPGPSVSASLQTAGSRKMEIGLGAILGALGVVVVGAL